MPIFEQLQKNKGTISSALSKELGIEVLNGNNEILAESIAFVCFDLKNVKPKHIRSGAAKIVETVAEKKPELIAPYLKDIYAALDVREPQTRWMVIRTFGFCAKLNPEDAIKGIPYAKKFIKERQGICLSGAAERYLGEIGALSSDVAQAVLPILLEAYDNPLPNEVDWILEGFSKIVTKLPQTGKDTIIQCAQEQLDSPRLATRKRAESIIALCK